MDIQMSLSQQLFGLVFSDSKSRSLEASEASMPPNLERHL
jgi:hypothetical protein